MVNLSAKDSINLEQISTCLRGLQMLVQKNVMPFVKVVAGSHQMLGKDGSVTLQFYDEMGNPVGVKGRSLENIVLKNSEGEEINVTAGAILDENAGKVIVNLNDQIDDSIIRGNFQVQIMLHAPRGLKKTVTSSDYVHIQTTISPQEFSYSMGQSDDASLAQAKGKWAYPARASFEE